MASNNKPLLGHCRGLAVDGQPGHVDCPLPSVMGKKRNEVPRRHPVAAQRRSGMSINGGTQWNAANRPNQAVGGDALGAWLGTAGGGGANGFWRAPREAVVRASRPCSQRRNADAPGVLGRTLEGRDSTVGWPQQFSGPAGMPKGIVVRSEEILRIK